MKSLNKVELIGRLGKDVELRFQPEGGAVGTISIATGSQYTDKDSGEKIDATEWHRCTSFGKQAELIDQFCKKGSLVFIEGRLKTSKWEDKEGVTRYTTEVIINDFIALDRAPASQQQAEA